ncbi:MAG TPA: PfkB family carbohydrate kinase [Roseiflexaceae bacterium]|nr:PfkB family carbohydrate kinase [Roseiflexaceae bacterium]
MIVAFGNPVYDYIKTPFITTGERVLSGGSTNGCLALTRLGHTTALVGRVGDDYHARFVADAGRYGITPFVQRCEQTGGFSLIYDARGDRTLDVLGVAAPIEEVPAVTADAEVVVVGPILQETPRHLIERIHAEGRPIFLDPQGLMRRIGPAGRIEHFLPDDFAAIARLCQVVKANEVEARIITGVDPRADGPEAARRLKALGCAIAIVTLAEAGSLIHDGRRLYVIPPYATEARDPTGAGDTYMAGFIDAYLRDPDDLYVAGCYGSATASIWIEHTGPDAPIAPMAVERRAATLIERRSDESIERWNV